MEPPRWVQRYTGSLALTAPLYQVVRIIYDSDEALPGASG